MYSTLPTTLEEALQLIRQLRAENRELRDKIEELRLQIGKNSSNSSKPPSTDKKGNTPGEGKHGGAKKGHKGAFRPPFTEEQVTKRLKIFPTNCPRCGSNNLVSERKPVIHQVVDLPEIKPEVTEYRLELCRCMGCGKHIRGELPLGVSRSSVGPRLTAWMGLASYQLSLPLRKINSLIYGLIQETFSPGTIFACQQRIREALDGNYEQLKVESKQEKYRGSDETSWRTHGKKRWVWVATGPTTTVLAITASRSRKCAEEFLGKNSHQPMITDRYPAYKFKGPHQYCLAHWKRNIEELKNFEQGQKLHDFLIRKIQGVFFIWHRYQKGEVSWRIFKSITTRRRYEIEKELRYHSREGPTKRIRSFCKNSLKKYGLFWTYTVVKGLEPTNNRAERDLRPIVIRRKICMGTKSQKGEEFLERIYSTCQTAAKRGIDILAYLKEVLICSWSKKPAPQLSQCV